MVQPNNHSAAAVSFTGGRIAPVISHPDELEWFELAPGEQVAICVHSAKVGGRYSAIESRASPGARAPFHHHREDEIFHILEGTIMLVCGRRVIEAGPGTTVVVPARTVHAWQNQSAATVRMLVTFVPGGLEDLFPRFAGLSAEQQQALASSYGTTILDVEAGAESGFGRTAPADGDASSLSIAMWP